MRNELVVSRPPVKLNMMYSVQSSIEETFSSVVKRIQEERIACPRVIVYCTNYRDCANIYLNFITSLGNSFTEPPDAPDLPRFRLVDMFMSCTEEIVKESIDIRQVIHYGSPSDIESYIQQTGRAGGIVFPPWLF